MPLSGVHGLRVAIQWQHNDFASSCRTQEGFSQKRVRLGLGCHCEPRQLCAIHLPQPSCRCPSAFCIGVQGTSNYDAVEELIRDLA